MNPEESALDPYDVVLADLKAKRAQLDQAIAAIEAIRAGGPAPTGLFSQEGARATPPADTTVRPGMFLGLNIADAVRKLLTMRKAPMGTPEITEALITGGLVFSTDTPGNTVGSVLHRQTRIGSGIISVGRGKWALAEWFPNPGRFNKKKGADKGGEEEAVSPTPTDAETGPTSAGDSDSD